MAKINLELTGTKEILKIFKEFGEDGVKELSDVTKFAAEDISLDAKRLAPVDTGRLRQIITTQEIDKLTQRIVALAKYAPYMEFGTGDLIEIPNELKELAAQFKGNGIKKINIPAQPFMWPAFIIGRKNYIKDLEVSLEELTKKFNK